MIYVEAIIFFVIVACFIFYLIIWGIIKSAVKSAMTEVIREQQIFVCNTPGSNDYLAQQIAENIVRLQNKADLAEDITK